MSRRRTYWHLEGAGRVPSEYEVVTSRLLYAPELSTVHTPVSIAERRSAAAARLRLLQPELFHDPRATTYASYVARQHRREIFLDELLDGAAATDASLGAAWLAVLEAVLPVLRYPFHGLQMLAAGAGSLAPGGRVVVAFLFQAADELRRVQRVAYRMRQLQLLRPGFGDGALARWQDEPGWQPWRRLIEQLLVLRDWGELLVALNLVVKPTFERVFLQRFADRARLAGDDVLHRLLGSLREDGAAHAETTAALVALLVTEDPANALVIEDLARPWRQAAEDAAAVVDAELLRVAA